VDEIDRAQSINEQAQADALAAHRRRQSAGPSAKECEDCAEEIPEKRRAAIPGCTRCVSCQELLENWRPL